MSNITIEQLREQRRKDDQEAIQEMNKKYGFDVSKYTKQSNSWHHGLVWNDEKIEGDLKSCPFCGGKAMINSFEYEDGLTYYIFCGECSAQSDEFDERLEAMIAWNKRV